MFLMKKIVAPLLYPFTMITGILIAGLILTWFTRKQKSSRRLITIGVALLLLFSYAVVPDFLLGLLEKQYSPLLSIRQAEKIKWVVVLGGGITSDPRLPSTGQVSNASMARLAEGIRIYKMCPGSKLLFSGGSVFDPKPEALVMAEIALDMGVAKGDILLDTVSKDTKGQAMTVSEITGSDTFVLVTSALHMPRAMSLFRAQGKEPIPAPTDFMVKDTQGFHPRSFFPNAYGLVKMERSVHEILGIVWAKIRGQV